MIKLIAFLKKHQRISNWTIIVSAILISVAIFLFNFNDVVAYEAACNDPVYVQATITVEFDKTLLSASEYFKAVLDYHYDGVHYQNVFYRSTQSRRILEDHGTTITVAVDPNNPGQLVRNMWNQWTDLSIPLWALGLSGLIYTLALAFPRFRAWRVCAANKPAWISRPYGKSKPEVSKPDYFKDLFFLMVLIWILTAVILSLAFPHTF